MCTQSNRHALNINGDELQSVLDRGEDLLLEKGKRAKELYNATIQPLSVSAN